MWEDKKNFQKAKALDIFFQKREKVARALLGLQLTWKKPQRGQKKNTNGQANIQNNVELAKMSQGTEPITKTG